MSARITERSTNRELGTDGASAAPSGIVSSITSLGGCVVFGGSGVGDGGDKICGRDSTWERVGGGDWGSDGVSCGDFVSLMRLWTEVSTESCSISVARSGGERKFCDRLGDSWTPNGSKASSLDEGGSSSPGESGSATDAGSISPGEGSLLASGVVRSDASPRANEARNRSSNDLICLLLSLSGT